jgi:aminoglycoside 6'-N-acetyltransferase I
LLTQQGAVGGWVAGEHAYGSVWELHPLIVAPRYQRRGYGRQLVMDLAAQVEALGALTLFLSTSDETDRTSLFGIDLYEDPLEALRTLRSTRPHSIDFYRKLGFKLVGVLPDAEGQGMPSIHFAMRIGARR